MALMTCSECGSNVSSGAKTCPSCGKRMETVTMEAGRAVLAVLVFLVIMVVLITIVFAIKE